MTKQLIIKFPLNLLLIFALFCSFSCSQKPAKIVDRSRSFYGRNNDLNREKYRNSTRETKSADKVNNREVMAASGDTLYSFAKRYQVTLRDLIRSNNLVAPYHIKEGDRLIIPAPDYHEVKAGDTLYSISRLYGMKLDQLIEMNDLKEPYSVKAGEKIRISKTETRRPEVREVKPIKTATKITAAKTGFIEKTLDHFNHFAWPVRGVVVSKFGPKSGGLYNDGINISAHEGEAVKASEDGVVAYVGNELKGYGNLIIIKHSGGWITAYAHLRQSLVKRGQKVAKGIKIGSVGMTGNVTSPQLYFGLRKGRDAVNPENYLKL